MTETKNIPPPHAVLSIVVSGHLAAGPFHDAELTVKGCHSCIVECFAEFLLRKPDFKELINKAVRLANERKAQKEN